jgi:hypothetical protein
LNRIPGILHVGIVVGVGVSAGTGIGVGIGAGASAGILIEAVCKH